MHAKRPRLIPIRDRTLTDWYRPISSVAEKALGRTASGCSIAILQLRPTEPFFERSGSSWAWISVRWPRASCASPTATQMQVRGFRSDLI